MIRAEAMKPEYADKVWTILVEDIAAHEPDREQFVRWAAKVDSGNEWRFQGSLGFGGKFWKNAGRWYVNCYPEDLALYPESQSVMDAANAKLEALKTLSETSTEHNAC